MTEDADHVGHARGQRDARRNGPRAMVFNQRPHPRLDDVVAAFAVGEDAQLIVHLLRAVHADRDADVVLREKLDDGGRQQRGVGGQAEVDVAALLFGLLIGVGDHLLQQREIHQRFAAEERDVNGPPVGRLFQQEIHRRLGRFHVHELRLAFGCGQLVGAKLVAVLARQIALVGEIHHQRLDGENFGKAGRFLDRIIARQDHVGVIHLRDEFVGLAGCDARCGKSVH